MNYKLKGSHYQSLVKNPNFFITANGANQAPLELEKTLQLFSELKPASEQHPQCQFPARYTILRQHFKNLAPPIRCPNFDAWRESYGLTSINVMYGSQYISNPTSSFGHSFFLLDSNRTLEYMRVTYNYGADIPPDVGARLVIDGLGGGFDGSYSVVPLFHRLHSYNDIENRDIWEYSLALTRDEQDLLLKILWEYQEKYTAPYYFLTGNCASVILETIQIVRPGLTLKTTSPFFSSPQEIFRVLYKNGLIKDLKYRPSSQKRLDDKLTQMSSEEKMDLKDFLSEKKELPKNNLVIESALDYIQFYRQKNGGETPHDLKSLEKKALLARAEMQGISKLQIPEQNWPTPPHEAQGPNLLSIGRSSKDKILYTLRPAFHDFLQSDAGFLPNSAIDVLSIDGSIPDRKSPQVESLTLGRLINFREVKVYDPFATSWILNSQIVRNSYFEDQQRYHLLLSPEIGWASKIYSVPLLVYILVGADARNGSIEPYGRLAFTTRAGILGSIGRFKTFISHRLGWQSEDAQTWLKRETELKLRYNLSPQWDLIGEFHIEETAEREYTRDETGFSMRYSF